MCVYLQRVLYKLLIPSLLLAGLAPAQTAAVDPPETVFRTDARLLVLNATVVDYAGNLISGLPRSSFRVFEEGVEQKVMDFRQEDAPVSLGIVVDRSPSMKDKRDRVATAALHLVRASHPEDEVFIMNFDENAYLDQDFTSDISKLERGLRNLDSRGGTAMRDALRLAAEHLYRRGKKVKKVVLVITDGQDNASLEPLQSLVRVAQQREVLVYAVGLFGGEDEQTVSRARRDLDALTVSTGGKAWYPKDIAEIDKIAIDMAHEIRNQYVLSYTPSESVPEGSYRRVKVEVDVPGATVRTRTGYYVGRTH